MKLVQRLYLKDFFLLLGLITFGLAVVFSLLDLINRLDNFLQSKPTTTDLVMYSILDIPKFIVYVLPMGILICSLFIFSQAFKRHEMSAVKAAGGRIKRLLAPFIISGLLLSGALFAASEFIVPVCTQKANALKYRMVQKTGWSIFKDGNLWLKTDAGYPVKIDLYIVEEKTARGVTVFVTENNYLKEKIIAESAHWNGTTWVLSNVTRYRNDIDTVERLKNMEYDGLESPDFFSNKIKTPDEMGISELYTYNQRLKNAGFKNMKILVDLNAKISFPLINIFMMLLGISLASRGRWGSGLMTAGLGLVIALGYWFSFTFMLSMGYAGVLHPLVAVWSIPFLFCAAASYLFLVIPE